MKRHTIDERSAYGHQARSLIAASHGSTSDKSLYIITTVRATGAPESCFLVEQGGHPVLSTILLGRAVERYNELP